MESSRRQRSDLFFPFSQEFLPPAPSRHIPLDLSANTGHTSASVSFPRGPRSQAARGDAVGISTAPYTAETRPSMSCEHPCPERNPKHLAKGAHFLTPDLGHSCFFFSLNPLAITQPGISTGSLASHLPVGYLQLWFSPHRSHTSGEGKCRRSWGWKRSLRGLKQLIKKIPSQRFSWKRSST